MCRRENNNNVGKFVKKNVKIAYLLFLFFVKIQHLFNLLLSTRKSVAEKKKDICHLNVYVAKLNLFFMKPNNLTSLRRMSRVRLAWHGFLRSKLAILQSQLKNPLCASSLFCCVTHGKGFRQNPAVPPPLHSNTILKMQVKDLIICLMTQVH